MPFFNGNWNLIFPSFISIIAPIVLRKGLPRIIGHEGLQCISRAIKSMGRINDVLIVANRNYVPVDFTILDIGFLIVESARCKFREQSSKSWKPNKSHKAFGIVETLAPKSHKA